MPVIAFYAAPNTSKQLAQSLHDFPVVEVPVKCCLGGRKHCTMKLDNWVEAVVNMYVVCY